MPLQDDSKSAAGESFFSGPKSTIPFNDVAPEISLESFLFSLLNEIIIFDNYISRKVSQKLGFTNFSLVVSFA